MTHAFLTKLGVFPSQSSFTRYRFINILRFQCIDSYIPLSMALIFYAFHILLIICSFSPTIISSVNFSYPAVFNFGDSNSDTGGLVAGVAFPLGPPTGQTYFNESAGRFCDGRLIIDFLSNVTSQLNLFLSLQLTIYLYTLDDTLCYV